MFTNAVNTMNAVNIVNMLKKTCSIAYLDTRY